MKSNPYPTALLAIGLVALGVAALLWAVSGSMPLDGAVTALAASGWLINFGAFTLVAWIAVAALTWKPAPVRQDRVTPPK